MSGAMREKRFNLSKKSIIIIAVCIVFLVGAITVTAALFSSGDKTDAKTVQTSSPQKASIQLSVTGSGIIEAYERYDIIPLVTGKILSSPYEEGDYVNEGDLLYEIDHEDMDINITKAQNALKRAQKNNEDNYENLNNTTLYSPESGVLTGFNLSVGDRVTQNQVIGTIELTDTIVATVAFNAAQFEKISVGDGAELYLYPSMYTCVGNVTQKSYKSYIDASGTLLYDIEITAKNPGAISSDTTVTASVTAGAEVLKSPVAGKILSPDAVDIKVKVSGEISEIYVHNGQKLSQNDVILKIDDTDIRDTLDRALLDYSDQELSLKSTMKRMEDYNITAPISGTVITKNYKTGDTISSGGGQTGNALMVVADMSKMKFTFSADETDINKIKIGQTVRVTADAVENTVYEGKVTKIASEGISNNGVTYFDVEVVIDAPDGLRPGMNVSAEIYYSEAVDVLTLPVSAVKVIRNESFVFVKGKTGANTDKTQNEQEKSEDMGDNSQITPYETACELAPQGTVPVRVETGITDGLIIEIISGVTDDDVVVLNEKNDPSLPVVNTSPYQMMGEMPAGMGGRIPNGMMGGGMMGR